MNPLREKTQACLHRGGGRRGTTSDHGLSENGSTTEGQKKSFELCWKLKVNTTRNEFLSRGTNDADALAAAAHCLQ